MSVDIAWDTITSGPDGAALSEKIRAFIHTKFQQITLPRFINSVHVHSFEFGSVSPEIEIKDIGDPLPDFYEDGDEDEDDSDQASRDSLSYSSSGHYPDDLAASSHGTSVSGIPLATSQHFANAMSPIQEGNVHNNPQYRTATSQTHAYSRAERPGSLDTHSFPRSSTPGIPGGTSNLSYFHLPVGGLSGAQTPLAAVASGTPFPAGPWNHDLPNHRNFELSRPTMYHDPDRPRTSDSIPSPEIGSPFDPSSPESRPVSFSAGEKVSDDLTLENLSISSAAREVPSNPLDLQVIARVIYDGDVRMTLTAEILLDYPMPSFVNIPLKLSVTGLKFDGVAILALIKKRMHFAFLDPEDAQTLVGDALYNETHDEGHRRDDVKSNFGSLLREVQIESEIGQQTNGKQVLKNVSKVEKFVLEQVKKIFEEEFVFPSFWTFLV